MKFLAALIFVSIISIAYCSNCATQVLDYQPGVNTAPYNNPLNALGFPSQLSTPNIPDNSSIVSLGSAGWIVLGFDQPIYNSPRNPSGFDFIVFGNAFYVGGNQFIRYQKPGVVEVGVFSSGHGYDSSTVFYKLQGSQNPVYSFSGVDERLNPTWGYSNVTPTNGSGNPLLADNPFTSGITLNSAGGDAFDISWAVDASGNHINLTKIDCIRIHSAGSWTTVIDAVTIIQPIKKYQALIQISVDER